MASILQVINRQHIKTYVMENNFKDLEEANEEANKEIDRSKVNLHNPESQTEREHKEVIEDSANNDVAEEEGSGLFTPDGKELPKIDGGYDVIEPGGSLGDDGFVSV
jgi:hypothetical protein